MSAIALVEFENASSVSLLKNSVHPIDVCFWQNVYPDYFVRCRFDIAVHFLKSLKHTHDLRTFTVRLRVYPVGAVTTALDNSMEYEDITF